MIRRLPIQLCGFAFVAAMAFLTSGARAQDGLEEPRWLRITAPEMHIGAEIQGLKEDVTLNNSSTSTHELIAATPLLGGRVAGSIYHPNLVSFDVSGEGGWGWAYDAVKGTGFNVTRHEDNQVVRYLATVNFLSDKPYNASFFAAQDHTYQNYDFFNTATVDSVRYGGRLGWTISNFDLNADMGYRDNRASGLTGTSEISDTYFHFNGIQHRDLSSTSVSYQYDDYHNRFGAGATQNSVAHSVSISDSETFGSRNQITAATGLNYSDYAYFNQSTESFNANENVTIKHGPNLDSFYNGNYNNSSQDPASSWYLQGMAGLRHQLYESLTSTLDVHGTYDDSSSQGTSARNDRYGLGLAENYGKRVTSWARLTLGASVIGDHEDHEASGSILTTLNEPHQLFLPGSPGFRPTFLNNPRVIISTIEVRDSGGIPALAGVDYQVVRSGELTEIRLVPGSIVLPSGSSVLVTYSSESLFNASFESVNVGAQVRLDMFNTFGVYGRLNWLDNNAPPEALVERLTDLVAGVDGTWRFIRAGAEYEDFDGNFTSYKAFRFFETFTFQPGEGTTVGFDFNQLFYRYPDSRRETQYQFLSHFNTRLTRNLSWNVEGGYYLDDAFGSEQTLAAGRTGLNFNFGKLTAKAGYQYNYQLTEATINREQRDRNFFYFYVRRTF